MSEPRKNHLNIDGGQVKEDHVAASYKPIPESDTDFRTSKTSLHKSKEKVSADGAEEKLLQKEEEAKIITRVDMADAKYVVGDHRNGDAKIELDANKRQFTGLTKEELMKYAEDPFWVRLRWFMFVLFWALWFCMLAGAIAIIVRAPKCPPPPPRTWYEKGPLLDMSSLEDLHTVAADLDSLDSSQVAGVFTFACKNTYDVLKEPTCIDQFKELLFKTKKAGIQVIVDLTANFVQKTHEWFVLSENKTAPYTDYFIWKPITEYAPEAAANTSPEPKPPNGWISLSGGSMWDLSETRKEFYLHHNGDDQPDLNFDNTEVVKQFDAVIKAWMQAGASGIRLQKARDLFVDLSFTDNPVNPDNKAAFHDQHDYYLPKYTSDQARLDDVLAHWSNITRTANSEAVFTIAEGSSRQGAAGYLVPPLARPVSVQDPVNAKKLLLDYMKGGSWPAVQLVDGDENKELAAFAMLLPATPVLNIDQLAQEDNDTAASEKLSHVISLREDGSIQHGELALEAAPTNTSDTVLACARVKKGHTGYVGVYNPGASVARANLTLMSWLPSKLSVHHVSKPVHLITKYTNNLEVSREDVVVPAKSTVILSFAKPEAKE